MSLAKSQSNDAQELREVQRIHAAGPDSARRRLINLLSRHPDLIAGRLEGVAHLLCKEAAEVLGCQRVALWKLTGDEGQELNEVAFNGIPIVEIPPRRKERRHAAALFATLERRRILAGEEVTDLIGPSGFCAVVLKRGQVWGALTFEGPWQRAINDLDFDFGIIVADMIGRSLEQSVVTELETELERARTGLLAFGRMLEDALCFEIEDGVLSFQTDPRSLIGAPPMGRQYRVADMERQIRADQLELLKRRYQGWVQAGAPGVLKTRFHYTAGPVGVNLIEVELNCRLMRMRSAEGRRLYGVIQRA